MLSSVSLIAACLTLVAAKTIEIDVGKSGFTFSQTATTANVGDTLEFHFFGSIHTAVQGDFSTPCQRGSLSSTGFYSGSIKNGGDGSGSVFQVLVNDTNPIYFYCSTPTHCQGGMVGAINAPSSGNTLDAYKSAAGGSSSSQAGASVQGGVVVPVGTNPQGGSPSVSTTSSLSSALSSAASATTSPSQAGTTGPSTTTSLSSPTTTVVPANGGSALKELAPKTQLMGIVVAGLGLTFAFA